MVDQWYTLAETPALKESAMESINDRRREKRKGKSVVHQGFPFADELTRSWSEIQEVLDWWRERKQFLVLALDTTRKRRRQTYHVEERFIEAIRRAADLERTDLAEIVNRAFERYFSK